MIVRLICFGVGTTYLFPVLRYQMKDANGYKGQRMNLRAEMFSIAGVIVTTTVWQIAHWEVPVVLFDHDCIMSFALTFFLACMTYYGVKIVKFRYPEDQRQRMGFGGKQIKKEE